MFKMFNVKLICHITWQLCDNHILLYFFYQNFLYYKEKIHMYAYKLCLLKTVQDNIQKSKHRRKGKIY